MDTNTFQLLLNAALATRNDASSISLAITIQIVSAVVTLVGMLFTFLKAKAGDDHTKESNIKLEKAEITRNAIHNVVVESKDVQDKIHEAVNGTKKQLEEKAIGLTDKVVDLTKELAVSQEQKIAAEKAVLLATVPIPVSPAISEDLIRRIVAEIRASDKQEKQP